MATVRLCTALAAVAFVTASSIAPAQTTVAGFTPGSFRVTESGSAEYRIPIRVPPGIAGMEPKLALGYNSQSGNGLMGVGWNLEGLSAITRCPRTLAQDGVRGSVNYDWNDRYCLDGQRLIAISGSYGADGTEYRTERESFSKVVSYGGAGNGPAWFQVWTKAGQILEYGNTADSRMEIQANDTVRVWALNKASDRKGNSTVTAYFEDRANGEYRPASIAYGSNHVTFGYAGRADVIPAFQAGSKMLLTHLLTQVRTFVGGQLVDDVRLSYGQSPETSRPRLASVKECNADGSACLPETTFGWQDGNTGISPWGWHSPYIGAVADFEHHFADVNGDGKADWIQVQRTANNGYVGLSNGDGTFPTWTWHSPMIGPANGYSHYFADVNGDGKTDWIQVENAANNGYVGLSNGDGSFTTWTWHSPMIGSVSGYQHFFADVNGDGRADWIQVERGSNNGYVGLSNGDGSFATWTWHSPMIGSFNGYHHYFADVNGDGKADWIQVERGANYGYVGLSIGDGSFVTWTWSSPLIGGVNGFEHYFADVNGDGSADWIQVSRGSNDGYVGVSSADGSFPTWTWHSTSIGSNDGHQHYFADLNGDGRQDWIQVTRASNAGYFGLSAGNGSFPTWNWGSYSIGAANDYQHHFADVNGDGKADWIQIQQVANNGYTAVASGAMTDLMISVTGGTGNATVIAYAPLTNAGVYAKDSGAVYPVQDVQLPMYVVSNFQAGNGIGGTNATHFMYGGLKAELGTGRGLLGFRWMDSYQAIGSAIVRSHAEFRQDWPYVGLPSVVRKSHGANALLSQAANTYSCTNPATGGACAVAAGNRYYPFASQSVETGADLNGTALPTVTTTTQHDGHGNPTSIAVSTGDGHSKATTNTFLNDVANWLLGRLTRSTVQSTSP